MAGKVGNKNALKHGIFAKRIRVVSDIKELESMSNDSNEAELAHARAMLADASDRRNGAKIDDDRLKWDYACRHWSEVIDNMIYRNLNKSETEMMIFNTLLDAVRAANDKQNVKR
jgi:hypothetical protein